MAAIHPVSDALSRRFEAARALANQAAALAMHMRPPPGAAQASLKSPQDWLTEADGAVETLLSRRLHALFPEDGFQGEEGGATRPGALRWVVDPIDGTSNYARGATRWCVSLALMDGPTPLIGILAAPALHETYTALIGRGATLNDAPIQAAATASLSRAIIEVGWSPRADNARYLATCGRVLAAGAMLRSGGSGALGLADVATGRLDAYVEQHINLWDCAAALALLAEAGATCTDFAPHAKTGGPILASAPALANQIGAMAEPPLSR